MRSLDPEEATAEIVRLSELQVKYGDLLAQVSQGLLEAVSNLREVERRVTALEARHRAL